MCFDVEDFSASPQSLASIRSMYTRWEWKIASDNWSNWRRNAKSVSLRFFFLLFRFPVISCFFCLFPCSFFSFFFFQRHQSQLNDIFPFPSFETCFFFQNLEMGQRLQKRLFCFVLWQMENESSPNGIKICCRVKFIFRKWFCATQI